MTEATITIARDPDTALQTDCHPVRSDWSETFWLPIIGPTSLLLLRRFDRDLANLSYAGVLKIPESLAPMTDEEEAQFVAELTDAMTKPIDPNDRTPILQVGDLPVQLTMTYDWCELSASLGLVPVTGTHSPLGKTLKRLVSFSLARYDAGTLLAPSHLPLLSYAQVRRLPDALKARYAEVTR